MGQEWNDQLTEMARLLIVDLIGLLESHRRQIGNLDNWINTFRESEQFLKVLSSDEVLKINLAQRKFPKMLKDIDEIIESLETYKKNFREKTVAKFIEDVQCLQRIANILEKRLSGIRTFLMEKEKTKKLFGLF